jgi:hypothetical protein
VAQGDLATAINLCNKEWASLPGSPYGQPTRTMAQATQTYLQAGGSLSEPVTQEKPVLPILPLVMSLGSTLIEAFAPLAKEKIQKEIGRHTDNPEIAEQVTSGIIESAKALTGKSDPIEAVVAAKADPQIMAQVESDALANLERLSPILDKMAAFDKQTWDAEEASRQEASERARGDEHDQDPFLTKAIVAMLCGVMLVVAALIGLCLYFKVNDVMQALLALFTTIAGGIGTQFAARYSHRYGSTRQSAANQAVLGELAKRK